MSSKDILLDKRRELENRLAQLLGQLAWMHDAVGEDIKPLLNEIGGMSAKCLMKKCAGKIAYNCF